MRGRLYSVRAWEKLCLRSLDNGLYLNKNHTVRTKNMRKLLLSLALLLLLATPACSQDDAASHNATAPAASANATAQGQDAHMGMDMSGEPGDAALSTQDGYSDKVFLSMMIPHHSGAVAMCNDVLKTTQDPQIKAWAEGMGKAQKDEIVIMLKWLQDLGGKDKDAWANMSDDMRAMHEQALSDNPDMNFVLMMIPHHAMALEMAYPALLQSEDPKVVDLARDIIMHQADEIRALRNWLDAHKPAAEQAQPQAQSN